MIERDNQQIRAISEDKTGITQNCWAGTGRLLCSRWIAKSIAPNAGFGNPARAV
jgi:hypothetical protein